MKKRILVVGDDMTFLFSTVDRLRREGYECSCASNGIEALTKLENETDWNLVVADSEKSGICDSALIEAVSRPDFAIPVILVTDLTSQHTAVKSIQFPIMAYLIKPFDYQTLNELVRQGVQKSLLLKSIFECQKRLSQWFTDLQTYELFAKESLRRNTMLTTLDYLDSLIANIGGMLVEIRDLSKGILNSNDHFKCCKELTKDGKHELLAVLEETVEVLQQTKQSFKSKKLGELRVKLQNSLKKYK